MTTNQATDLAANKVVSFEDHLNFARVPHAILYSEHTACLTPIDKLFLIYLSASLPFNDRKWQGVRFDGVETYAKWLNISTRHVTRTKTKLEKLGFLKIQKRSKGQTKRSDPYQASRGRASDFIWINPKIFVLYKKFYPLTPCPSLPDNPQGTPPDHESDELDISRTRNKPNYTTGQVGLSSLEKKISERLNEVSPSAKFNLPKFRELQERERLKVGTMLNRLDQIEANPFLHAQCTSVSMIFYMKNRRSRAYETARNLAKSFHRDISSAKTQAQVDQILDEIVSARTGWTRSDIVHFFRNHQGYDPKPGAPAITRKGWVECNQPPNPAEACDSAASGFGDITGEEPKVEPTEQAIRTTSCETREEAGPLPTLGSEGQQQASTSSMQDTPRKGSPGSQSQSDEFAPSAPPLEPPPSDGPTTASEVISRIKRLRDPAIAKILADMALKRSPTDPVVVRNLISAEAVELANAA